MSGGIVYEQKNIVLVPFPYTDLTQNKKRPALLLSNVIGDDFLCCLITSKQANDGILLDDLEGNLPLQSWVKPHRIFTVDKRIILKKLCSITPELHENIISKIHEYIKLQKSL